MINKITIIGLGLMGGSLAKIARKKKLAKKICALAKNDESRQRFERLHLVDLVTTDLEEAVRGADVIVLCTTPSLIMDYIRRLRTLAESDALIMDIGSTKEQIMTCAQKIFSRKSNYVGAHPMAGSEKAGAEYASADLYEQSVCILTPLKQNGFFTQAERFWQDVGCTTITMSPREHDLTVAYVSHLPHVIAFSFLAMVPEKMRRCGAGAYKSLERLALSDPALWADIFTSNKKQLSRALKDFHKRFLAVAQAIDRKPKEALERGLKTQKTSDCRS